MSHERIALVGDFDPAVTAHRAIQRCFDLARDSGSYSLEPEWLATQSIVSGDCAMLERFSGFWCVPASPYRNTAGALWAIQYAREQDVPFLGTCGGFQHALLEYARNVLKLKNAEHAEMNPDAELPLLARLQCSLVEASFRVVVTRPGPFREAYGADSGVETFRCNYGLNPQFEPVFDAGQLEIAARSEEGEARGFQLLGHRFFIGALFQPERRALEGDLHPIVRAFFAACSEAR
jgi:CTP synthase (UTP-ammonia lyase)